MLYVQAHFRSRDSDVMERAGSWQRGYPLLSDLILLSMQIRPSHPAAQNGNPAGLDPTVPFAGRERNNHMDTPMITLKHIVKSFSGREAAVHAVRDVSLTIERGSIYGIVGFSGAGKSTLVRCINLLERPTSGRVFVDGTELTALHGRALSEQRKKIGMIFQQFNLFATRTVFENVAFLSLRAI